MANTYEIVVNKLVCYASYESRADVVHTIHWVMNGSDGKGHLATDYGATELIYDAQRPFIPYDSLTRSQVLTWVNTALGSDGLSAYKKSIDNKIADQISPTIVTPPLPWA